MSVKGINVCIYGLNRSLGTTVYSIKKKILQHVASIADEAHFYAAFNVTGGFIVAVRAAAVPSTVMIRCGMPSFL